MMIASLKIMSANRCCPAGIHLLKVKYRNTRTSCRSGIFIVNFEHISHLVLVFVLLTLNM